MVPRHSTLVSDVADELAQCQLCFAFRQSGSRIGSMSVIEWKQASVAGVKLRRFTGHVGGIEVGSVEFDGSNRLWTWSSPFAEDVWGHAPTQAGAQKALEIWLRGWLEKLRPVLDAPSVERGP
jgi:hypothetical protein